MLRATIINYGVGNLFSVSNALKRLGIDVRILSEPTGSEDLVVLPGVGGFKAAMETLREKAEIPRHESERIIRQLIKEGKFYQPTPDTLAPSKGY